MKLEVISRWILLAVFFCMACVGHLEAAPFNDDDHTISGLLLSRNLARNEPVENILFAHVGRDTYRCFKMDGTEGSWRFVISHVPYNKAIASYTLYPDAVQNLIEGLTYSDQFSLDNCKYPYVVCKPLIIFSLRVAEPKRRMLFYRILSTEKGEWRDYLPAFLTVANESDGTLTFDWRLVYQVAFYIDTSGTASRRENEHHDGYTDDGRMEKQYTDVKYLETLIEDWRKDNPQITPKNWQEEYQKTMTSKDYSEQLEKILAGIDEGSKRLGY